MYCPRIDRREEVDCRILPVILYREAPIKHTPLTIAAFNGRHEVVEVLLNRNANVDHQYVPWLWLASVHLLSGEFSKNTNGGWFLLLLPSATEPPTVGPRSCTRP